MRKKRPPGKTFQGRLCVKEYIQSLEKRIISKVSQARAGLCYFFALFLHIKKEGKN